MTSYGKNRYETAVRKSVTKQRYETALLNSVTKQRYGHYIGSSRIVAWFRVMHKCCLGRSWCVRYEQAEHGAFTRSAAHVQITAEQLGQLPRYG
jgi:hypothetical protein